MAAMASNPALKTKQWATIRRQVLQEEPLCQIQGPKCSQLATEVDHIHALSAGGDPYERSNLRGSCRPCNRRNGIAIAMQTRKANEDLGRAIRAGRAGSDAPAHAGLTGEEKVAAGIWSRVW
jgi:HNH endonuclease